MNLRLIDTYFASLDDGVVHIKFYEDIDTNVLSIYLYDPDKEESVRQSYIPESIEDGLSLYEDLFSVNFHRVNNKEILNPQEPLTELSIYKSKNNSEDQRQTVDPLQGKELIEPPKTDLSEFDEIQSINSNPLFDAAVLANMISEMVDSSGYGSELSIEYTEDGRMILAYRQAIALIEVRSKNV